MSPAHPNLSVIVVGVPEKVEPIWLFLFGQGVPRPFARHSRNCLTGNVIAGDLLA